MKPEEQRIAIAEALGAKWRTVGKRRYLSFKEFRNEWGLQHLPGDPALDVPNYPGDLNAMHEAEKMLTNGQKLSYISFLVTGPFEDGIFAAAAQRAEAFLRTLDIWEERPKCKVCGKRDIMESYDHCGNDDCIPF